MAIIPLLHPDAGVDPVRDLATVGTVATVPIVLSVRNKSGIKTLPELLARMKSPPKLNFGSVGPGTMAHLAEGVFLHLSKTQGALIQYLGSAPPPADLMAGVTRGLLARTVPMMPRPTHGPIPHH